jgi:hypothetical protein
VTTPEPTAYHESREISGALHARGIIEDDLRAATPELAEFYLAVAPRADQRLCPEYKLPFPEPPPLVKVDRID